MVHTIIPMGQFRKIPFIETAIKKNLQRKRAKKTYEEKELKLINHINIKYLYTHKYICISRNSLRSFLLCRFIFFYNICILNYTHSTYSLQKCVVSFIYNYTNMHCFCCILIISPKNCSFKQLECSFFSTIFNCV